MEQQTAMIGAIVAAGRAWRDPAYPARVEAVRRTLEARNRFTDAALTFAVNQQMHLLTRKALERWGSGHWASRPVTVGVLNAGNVPLAGLQDLLAVLLTGHRYFGTTSSKSPFLLPAFAEEIVRTLKEAPVQFGPVEALWSQAEAVIATGGDETRAWAIEQCEALAIPPDHCLLRGHRFAVAVIDGKERTQERDNLAEDALLHEGYGCRNVALIWAPEGTSPDPYLEAFAVFRSVFPPHPRTPGTLKMQQAFLKAVDLPHAYGEGLEFLLSKGPPEVQRPGHIRWVEYADLEDVCSWLKAHENALQFVAARPALAAQLPDHLPLTSPGEAQRPPLDWQPDGQDTVAFLAGL